MSIRIWTPRKASPTSRNKKKRMNKKKVNNQTKRNSRVSRTLSSELSSIYSYCFRSSSATGVRSGPGHAQPRELQGHLL